MQNPEDIVRNFTYDPTGTHPEPPFATAEAEREYYAQLEREQPSTREKIAKGLLWVAVGLLVVGLVVAVRV